MTGLLAGVVIGLVVTTYGAAPGSHVDARDYPAPGQGVQAFGQMEQALVRGFDDICGDTFCEGEYYNLRALQLVCSVDALSTVLAGCVWSFAGSWAQVHGRSGSVEVFARTYTCPLLLAEGTTLPLLLSTLAGHDALHLLLPGTQRSTYDALVDCL